LYWWGFSATAGIAGMTSVTLTALAIERIDAMIIVNFIFIDLIIVIIKEIKNKINEI
jgi:hypothetical protein